MLFQGKRHVCVCKQGKYVTSAEPYLLKMLSIEDWANHNIRLPLWVQVLCCFSSEDLLNLTVASGYLCRKHNSCRATLLQRSGVRVHLAVPSLQSSVYTHRTRVSRKNNFDGHIKTIQTWSGRTLKALGFPGMCVPEI